MAPILIFGEKKQQLRTILLFAIVLLFIAEVLFTNTVSILSIAIALLIYFVGFNLLEALQPSLVSRFAKESKGTALGVYNTTQSIGLFSGAVIGGYLMDSHGDLSVFAMGAALLICWLIIAWSMRELPAKTVVINDSEAKTSP
jgi:predicted MFS family arabinose efflux permease